MFEIVVKFLNQDAHEFHILMMQQKRCLESEKCLK
jgi:hypothetical protein